jgi:hypothetical protein
MILALLSGEPLQTDREGRVLFRTIKKPLSGIT